MVLPATASHGINPLIKASLITASLNAVMLNGAVNSTGPHGTALLGTLPPNTALLGTTFLGKETYAAVAMHADGNEGIRAPKRLPSTGGSGRASVLREVVCRDLSPRYCTLSIGTTNKRGAVVPSSRPVDREVE